MAIAICDGVNGGCICDVELSASSALYEVVVLIDPIFPCYQDGLNSGVSVSNTTMVWGGCISSYPYRDDPLFFWLMEVFMTSDRFFWNR